MASCRKTKTLTFVLFLIFQFFPASSGLLYIVRQNCNRGTVFTPVPSTVNNICLQCKCVMSDISYCKLLAVQLSVVCSAAVAATATTASPTTTTSRAPTIPTATATTATGINPRAPAAGAMNMPAPAVMMVTVPPMMMMMVVPRDAQTMTSAPAPTAG